MCASPNRDAPERVSRSRRRRDRRPLRYRLIRRVGATQCVALLFAVQSDRDGYACLDNRRRNFPRRMRWVLLVSTRSRVFSLTSPAARTSFIGVQYVSIHPR